MRDTIDMAREAGIYHAFDSEGHWDGLTDVKLIEPNPHHNDVVYGEKRTVEILKAFEALVRADEREACAKVCEEYDDEYDVHTKQTVEGIALQIRARGNT